MSFCVCRKLKDQSVKNEKKFDEEVESLISRAEKSEQRAVGSKTLQSSRILDGFSPAVCFFYVYNPHDKHVNRLKSS